MSANENAKLLAERLKANLVESIKLEFGEDRATSTLELIDSYAAQCRADQISKDAEICEAIFGAFKDEFGGATGKRFAASLCKNTILAQLQPPPEPQHDPKG